MQRTKKQSHRNTAHIAARNMHNANDGNISVTERLSRLLFLPVARIIPNAVSPNHITIFRIVLIPIIVVLLIANNYILALITYLLAAYSDGVDGALARIRNKATIGGAVLDPIVDKFLHIALFLPFLQVAPILIPVMIVLEIGLIGIAGIITMIVKRYRGVLPEFRSATAGKWKFAFQAFAISAFLAERILGEVALLYSARAALVGAILFSVIAIVQYVYRVTQKNKT